MMLELQLRGFYRKAGGDKRLRRPHLCPYMALLAQSTGTAFQVNRKEVMALARIDSRVTYHRCIRELDKWGYIHCQPSYDPGSKSLVYITPYLASSAKQPFLYRSMKLVFVLPSPSSNTTGR